MLDLQDNNFTDIIAHPTFVSSLVVSRDRSGSCALVSVNDRRGHSSCAHR